MAQIRATMRRVGMVNEPSGAWGLTMPRGVYEALAPLECGHCQRPIPVGEPFTRRKLFGEGRASPVCRACAPFAEPG